MNFTGIIFGVFTFLIIGILHPVVIWTEYTFSKNCWPVFAIIGSFFIILSFITQVVVYSCFFALVGANFLWCIKELFEQEKRVSKGWFPCNPKRKNKAS